MTGTAIQHKTLPVTTHSNGRSGHKVEKVVVHHMAGNLSLEECQKVFQNRNSSATYAIDTKGNIAQYVDENDRPWTTSGADPDNYCITIELANDQIGGNWHISEATIRACVGLVADICERYGISKLFYNGKNGTLLRHCDYHATACPGPYFKSITNDFCTWVNQKMEQDKNHGTEQTFDTLYKVQTGAFSSKANAEAMAEKLNKSGFATTIKEEKKDA